MKRMVEDTNEKLMNLINNYPKEVLDLVLNDNFESFKQYVELYNPITKDLIAAYIFCNYIYDGRLFSSAEIADDVLEIFEILDSKEIISFIEKLYIHYENGMCNILSSTAKVLVRLYIGTMTIDDVIKEEQKKSTKDFRQFINQYLEYMKDGISFSDLYFMMMFDYTLFRKGENKQTNIESSEDGIQKVKALYCANHIYSNKNNNDEGSQNV